MSNEADRMIELTDLMVEDGETVVVPVEGVAAAIRQWYPEVDYTRPSELTAIREFQEALIEQDYLEAANLAAELAVGFTEVELEEDAEPEDEPYDHSAAKEDARNEWARRELAEGPAIVGRTSLHRGAWFNR